MENNLELSIFPQNYMKSYEGANGNKICYNACRKPHNKRRGIKV